MNEIAPRRNVAWLIAGGYLSLVAAEAPFDGPPELIVQGEDTIGFGHASAYIQGDCPFVGAGNPGLGF